MNDKRFRRVAIAVGICIFALSVFSPVFAREGHGDRKYMCKNEKMDAFMDELNLTAEQKEQIQQQRETHRSSVEELRESLRIKRQELREELEKQEVDRTRIEGLASDVKNIQDEMVDERIEGVLSLKEILTPEQYELFQKKTKQHMEQKRKQRRDKQ